MDNRLAFTYNDNQLDIVDNFNYLGVVFNYAGILLLNQQYLSEKSLKAMYTLLCNVRILILPRKHCVNYLTLSKDPLCAIVVRCGAFQSLKRLNVFI